ncbi:MAG: PASTA domain-containing protein [Actinobacteria bacterium]|nr:PASTA domain-containing protein [Actinomycetota bacterium]
MALPMRRFTLLTIIGLFLVLSAATVYQVLLVKDKPHNLVGPGLDPKPGEVILTNLVGKLREDALAELRAGDLRYRVVAAGDDEGATDRVVSQDPGGGILVQEGTVVTLRVDCGPPAPCPAPPEGEEIVDSCSCETA